MTTPTLTISRCVWCGEGMRNGSIGWAAIDVKQALCGEAPDSVHLAIARMDADIDVSGVDTLLKVTMLRRILDSGEAVRVFSDFASLRALPYRVISPPIDDEVEGTDYRGRDYWVPVESITALEATE